jgi:hypothetical protein
MARVRITTRSATLIMRVCPETPSAMPRSGHSVRVASVPARESTTIRDLTACTFARAVQQAPGRTAKAYLVDRRVPEAKRLLARDRLTAAGCANSLGFPATSSPAAVRSSKTSGSAPLCAITVLPNRVA